MTGDVRRVLGLAAVVVTLLAGCAGAPAAVESEAPPAREGIRLDNPRPSFVPDRLRLPSGDQVTIVPVATVDGELEIPDGVDRAGWWDGSARVGDPYGHTVIAGHVDTATDGVALFSALVGMEVGDEVTVAARRLKRTYRVVSSELVAQDAIATDSDAFEQAGVHRLVLITCWGTWRPDLSSYDSNLVVTAEPVSRG